jgi:hypothetical protein
MKKRPLHAAFFTFSGLKKRAAGAPGFSTSGH